jgi:hypothetical protein
VGKQGHQGLLLFFDRLDRLDGLLGGVPAVLGSDVPGATEPLGELRKMLRGIFGRAGADGAPDLVGPGGHRLAVGRLGRAARDRRLEVLFDAGQAPREDVWGKAGARLELIPPYSDRGAVESDIASRLLASVLAEGTFDFDTRLLVEDGLVRAHGKGET